MSHLFAFYAGYFAANLIVFMYFIIRPIDPRRSSAVISAFFGVFVSSVIRDYLNLTSNSFNIFLVSPIISGSAALIVYYPIFNYLKNREATINKNKQ